MAEEKDVEKGETTPTASPSDEEGTANSKCARSTAKAIWEMFNGIGGACKGIYEWWQNLMEENKAAGIGMLILLILGFIFLVIPAAFILAICFGILLLIAVMIEAFCPGEKE